MQRISDAIHDVTAKVQVAIDSGRRSRQIDADDVVEILLAIADQLDTDEPAASTDEELMVKLAAIAKSELRVPTLEPRGRDSLDFHDIGVAGLRKALLRAYHLGRDSQ